MIPNFIELHDDWDSAVPENGPILFVGTGIPEKGLGVALEAFSQWRKGDSRDLHVVGSIANQEHKAGVNYRGFLTGNALWEAYRAASIVVVPSTWQEPCPTVALEAMAFGRPVIGSAVGGIKDIVVDRETGMLVPPNDVAALVGAFNTLTANRGMLSAMGRNGRKRVREFSVDQVVPRIEHLYASVQTSA